MDGYIQVLDNMRKNSWLIISLFICLSCGRESITPELGLDYYPIETGTYRIYDVEETTYLNKVPTTETYQLKESIIESGSLDQTSFLLRIEKRANSGESWASIKSIYLYQTNHILEYRDDNISKIAMSYPVRVGRTWDGNALNNDPEQIYHYDKGSNNGFEVDQIKVVLRDLPPNIVEQDQRYEIYGKGIGLIERRFTVIEYCQIGCSSANEPENGVVLTQVLVEYGEE